MLRESITRVFFPIAESFRHLAAAPFSRPKYLRRSSIISMTKETSNPLRPDEEPRIVKLPPHHLRSLTSALNSFYRPSLPPPPSKRPLTVVCVSDTHGTRPSIPPGDLLLHAGDLTNWGTFSEIQAQLTWLSEQPHVYKVVIAGNHDLYLDSEFKERHPERWKQAVRAASIVEDPGPHHYPATKLDWGDLVYLQDSSVTLSFPSDRSLRIYGSPYTPQYGLSAFQHLPSVDIWTERVPLDTDIILTHGPPRGHLDGWKKSGCAFLTQEIVRVRPRLVVYGHIHQGYGTEERVYDRAGRAYERISVQGAKRRSLVGLACHVMWGYLIPKSWRRPEGRTTFVNAAVVEGWENHVLKNEAVVLQI